ncbi:hypothetical protein [Pseudomonas sp. microsymbiont 2]
MDYPKRIPNVGLVGGKFVDENVSTGLPGSLIPSAWGNAVTDEVLAVIKSAGLTPSEDDNAQLLKGIQGLAASDVKRAVRVATTGPIALSGLQTIDGVALADGDRVLVKNQANAAQNWIYTASANTWVRALDANENAECTPGHLIIVQAGTAQAGTMWQLTNTLPPQVGTTALTFAMLFGKTGVTAGDYRKVSVDALGRVTGGSNPTTLAGYGITDAATLETVRQELTRFGIGTNNMPDVINTDLKTMFVGGNYFIGAGCTGLPPGTAYGYLNVLPNAFNEAVHTFYSGHSEWRCFSTAGVFSDWEERLRQPVINATFAKITDVYKKSETYGRSEVYSRSETYGKADVYNKSETYGKADIYSKGETYNRDEVYRRTETYSRGETYHRTETYSRNETYHRTETYSQAEVRSLTDALGGRIWGLEQRQLPLGEGQSWKDLKAWRALSTTYTNTTGRSIMVTVTGSITTGASLTAVVGGVVAATQSSNAGYANPPFLSFVVPAGHSYSVSGTGTISSWSELQ